MSTRPKVRQAAGWFIWVTSDGKPGVKMAKTKKKPRPITTVHSRAIMRQENKDGSGKFFQDRKVAFEDAKRRWVLLYESKFLKLMNSSEKYINIWGNSNAHDEDSELDEPMSKNINMKLASHILEMSVPVHSHGRMVLESMCYTIPKNMKKGRFLIEPPKDESRLFDTNSVAAGDKVFPLIRQCSNSSQKTRDFRVCCRKIAAPNIDLIFIVYPKTMTLNVPDIIDKKTYRALIVLEKVLIFKQVSD